MSLSFFFIIFSSFSKWRGLFLGLPGLLVSQGKLLSKVRVHFPVRLCVCSVVQLCPTLYDSVDCSPTGSSVHGIFQARLLQFSSGQFNHSVVSDSLRPHGLWPTRLLCPWESPGKKTAVGSHSLLQGMFPTQGSNPHLLHWQVDSFTTASHRKPIQHHFCQIIWAQSCEKLPWNGCHYSLCSTHSSPHAACLSWLSPDKVYLTLLLTCFAIQFMLILTLCPQISGLTGF